MPCPISVDVDAEGTPKVGGYSVITYDLCTRTRSDADRIFIPCNLLTFLPGSRYVSSP